MGECPSKECHNRVEGHHNTLYGPDGRGGVVGEMPGKAGKDELKSYAKDFKECLRHYVRRPPTWLIASVVIPLLIVFVGTGIKVWSSQESSPHVYTKKEDSQKRETRLTVVERAQEQVARDIDEIKNTIKAQKRETNVSIDEIKDTFKIQKLEIKDSITELKDMLKVVIRRHVSDPDGPGPGN